MNRKEFKKMMRSNDTAASEIEVKKVIGDILKSETQGINCVICMEELAELQQEISKQLRKIHMAFWKNWPMFIFA